MADNSNRPERPRLEPEIIPPARGRRDSDWVQHTWHSYGSSEGGTRRIHVGRLGPVGVGLVMLIIGIVIAFILLAVVGAILIWIPVLAGLLAVGAIFRLIRRGRL